VEEAFVDFALELAGDQDVAGCEEREKGVAGVEERRVLGAAGAVRELRGCVGLEEEVPAGDQRVEGAAEDQGAIGGRQVQPAGDDRGERVLGRRILREVGEDQLDAIGHATRFGEGRRFSQTFLREVDAGHVMAERCEVHGVAALALGETQDASGRERAGLLAEEVVGGGAVDVLGVAGVPAVPEAVAHVRPSSAP
jgi:hypothetical protein